MNIARVLIVICKLVLKSFGAFEDDQKDQVEQTESQRGD